MIDWIFKSDVKFYKEAGKSLKITNTMMTQRILNRQLERMGIAFKKASISAKELRGVLLGIEGSEVLHEIVNEAVVLRRNSIFNKLN